MFVTIKWFAIRYGGQRQKSLRRARPENIRKRYTDMVDIINQGPEWLDLLEVNISLVLDMIVFDYGLQCLIPPSLNLL